MTRLLVALDESSESLLAATLAARLFGSVETEYIVINVERPPDSWTEGSAFCEVMPRPGPRWLEDGVRVVEDDRPELRARAGQRRAA